MAEKGSGDTLLKHNKFMAELHSAYTSIDERVHATVLECKARELDPNLGVIYRPPDDDGDGKRRVFSPSLQRQRNEFVKQTLATVFADRPNENGHKLAVMGCGEMSLESHLLMELPSLDIRSIYSIDRSGPDIVRSYSKFSDGRRMMDGKPVYVENVHGLPVHMQTFWGDITNDVDERVQDADIVVSTEVIEHMPLEKATRFVNHVLKQIQPELFILSTPNREYNMAFGMQPEALRHWDHCFEFDRSEFAHWVNSIVQATGSKYALEIQFIGKLDEHAHLGGATQFAILKRLSSASLLSPKPSIVGKSYKLAWFTILYFGMRYYEFHRMMDSMVQYVKDNPDFITQQAMNINSSLVVLPAEEIFEMASFPRLLIRYNKLEYWRIFSRSTNPIFRQRVPIARINSAWYFVPEKKASVEELVEYLREVQALNYAD